MSLLEPLKKRGKIQWPEPSPPLPKFAPEGKMFVYYLICPVTHRVRYIGCTMRPYFRWRSHYGMRNNTTREWIEWLVERELLPVMHVVAGPLKPSKAYAEEERRIAIAKRDEWPGLLNRSNGW